MVLWILTPNWNPRFLILDTYLVVKFEVFTRIGVKSFGCWALMSFNLTNTFVPPLRTIRATLSSTLKMEAADTFFI
jgi:hypothetical protein